MRGRGPRARRGASRSALDATGAALLTALGAVAAVRRCGEPRHPGVLGAQGVARLALLPAWPLAALSLVRGRPAAAALSAWLVAEHIFASRRSRGTGRPDSRYPDGSSVRLVTANLLLTNPELIAASRQLLADRPDVLVVQELTPQHLDVFRREGVFDHLPHAVLDARPGYHGSAVLTRWPIVDPAVLDVEGSPMASAVVATPAGPLRVVSVHDVDPSGPGQLVRWQRQLQRLAGCAAESEVPLVLAGDFNATADHRDFRRLVGAGLRDAAVVAARGSLATWPVWRRPFPRLMALDHVLVSAPLRVTAAFSAVTAGSDHRRLCVDLDLPSLR